jgi:hypothetical protein
VTLKVSSDIRAAEQLLRRRDRLQRQAWSTGQSGRAEKATEELRQCEARLAAIGVTHRLEGNPLEEIPALLRVTPLLL